MRLCCTQHTNPLSLFLYTRVLVSEEAYLEFSSAAMPGIRVLPGIQGKARKKMLLANSASAPVLAPGGRRWTLT